MSDIANGVAKAAGIGLVVLAVACSTIGFVIGGIVFALIWWLL